MFEDLDDPQATMLTPPIDAVARRVVRKRRQRRFATSGVAALVLLVGVVTTAAVAGDDRKPGNTIEASESSDATSTTTRSTSSTVDPSTTIAPAPATETTPSTAPPRPRTTTTTLPADDPALLRDWSHVSFDAPGRFDITTGQSIDFEFTMHNEGAWTVAVDNGCPWFTHGGAKVVCPTGIGDRLKPGQSAHGVATFYARAYGDGGSWNPADPYDPIAPSTYYVHGMLRDQYVFDNVTGSNSRKVIGVAVFADAPKLTTAAEPAELTLAPEASTTVAVTMRNDTDAAVWDWGCHEFNNPVPRIGDDPGAVDLGPAGDSPAYLCADRGWRAPGWAQTYTVPVSAAGLAPGEYRLTWARTPEIPLLDLSVVAP